MLLHYTVHYPLELITQAACCLPCTVEHGATSFAAFTGWPPALQDVRQRNHRCHQALLVLTATQAFAHLAVRLLVHQLQESPTLLGACTPAAVLVPALGQLLSYGTAALQVSSSVSFTRTHTHACLKTAQLCCLDITCVISLESLPWHAMPSLAGVCPVPDCMHSPPPAHPLAMCTIWFTGLHAPDVFACDRYATLAMQL